MEKLIYNTKSKDLIRGMTRPNLTPLESMSGLHREANILRSNDVLRKLFDQPVLIKTLKAQPDKVNIQIADNYKIQRLDSMSGLQKEANTTKYEKQISIIRGVNQALKSGLPALAEDILGRKLTPEELVNGRMGLQMLTKLYKMQPKPKPMHSSSNNAILMQNRCLTNTL